MSVENPESGPALRSGGLTLVPGQVAVVTGAASGIGFAIADALAAAGVDIALSDVEADALAAASERITGRGVRTIAVTTDVTDARAVEQLATRTLDEFGRIDIVVNNAGVAAAVGPLWEVPLEETRWVMNVDLFGVIHGIRFLVPHLVAQGRGHVVNVSSLAGLVPIPFNGPYNAAKYGVLALSETLRDEFAELAPGVGVSVVCPGVVATRIRESGRNRPHGAPPPPSRRPVAPAGGSIDPAEIAMLTLDAIRTGRFVIAAPQHVIDDAMARMDRITRDLQEASTALPQTRSQQ